MPGLALPKYKFNNWPKHSGSVSRYLESRRPAVRKGKEIEVVGRQVGVSLQPALYFRRNLRYRSGEKLAGMQNVKGYKLVTTARLFDPSFARIRIAKSVAFDTCSRDLLLGMGNRAESLQLAGVSNQNLPEFAALIETIATKRDGSQWRVSGALFWHVSHTAEEVSLLIQSNSF